MPIGARLREERERIGLSQPKFAAIAGTTKQTLFSWESGKTAPDALQLAALASAEVDVLYVLTGQRSNVASTQHLPASQIDGARLERIVAMLEASAATARRQWPAARLVAVAAEIYNVLADEPALDEPKVERILKLVVNR